MKCKIGWILGKGSSPEGDGHGTGSLGQCSWPKAFKQCCRHRVWFLGGLVWSQEMDLMVLGVFPAGVVLWFYETSFLSAYVWPGSSTRIASKMSYSPSHSDIQWPWEHPYPLLTKTCVQPCGRLVKNGQTCIENWELGNVCKENSATQFHFFLLPSLEWRAQFSFPTVFFSLVLYAEAFTNVAHFTLIFRYLLLHVMFLTCEGTTCYPGSLPSFKVEVSTIYPTSAPIVQTKLKVVKWPLCKL